MSVIRTASKVAAHVTLLTVALVLPSAQAPVHELPLANGSVRFAVIGDSGTGGRQQYEVARRLTEARQRFPFRFVLMLGDNLYGRERPNDYIRKFSRPYRALLDGGVTFHAAIGNHDERVQRYYEPFNMGGQLYYSFAVPASSPLVRFIALDSTYMSPSQLAWLERTLAAATERWKIAYFHHPIYSSGARHGSDVVLRRALEPLFVKYEVNAALAGHEHFYERLQPQKGVYYFTSGAAAKLRRGNIRLGPLTAAGFDQDRSFMLVEIAGDTLHFQAISRTGRVVDAGALPRLPGE